MMTSITKNEFDTILRQDFLSFLQKSFATLSAGVDYEHNWHIEAMAHCLDACHKGTRHRQIITLPPRHLKSIICSVAWPAFLLGHDPTKRIICVSYAEDLAAKHARDFRKLIKSSWYRRIFPNMRISRRKNTEFEIETTRGGGRLATSVGGSLTGLGGSIIILDDPQKPQEAMSDTARQKLKNWYGNTLLSRLDSKVDSVILLVMQRLHIDDLVAHVKETEAWHHLDLPSIAYYDMQVLLGDNRCHNFKKDDILHPAREPKSALQTLRNSMGSMAFSAQYLQQPVPFEGNLIKWGWFKFYDNLPQEGEIIQSWDTALGTKSHNDWSVCTTWLCHKNRHYLIDIYRERLDFPSLLKAVSEQYSSYNASSVLIEEVGGGMGLSQQLRHQSQVFPIGIQPQKDKISRLQMVSHMIEAGQIFLPKNAPWLAEFQSEILAFPQSRHDDQVDSFSQYLNWKKESPMPRIRLL